MLGFKTHETYIERTIRSTTMGYSNNREVTKELAFCLGFGANKNTRGIEFWNSSTPI